MRLLLAIFFIAAGIMHFVIPGAYIRIVPPLLPAPGLLVILSRNRGNPGRHWLAHSTHSACGRLGTGIAADCRLSRKYLHGRGACTRSWNPRPKLGPMAAAAIANSSDCLGSALHKTSRDNTLGPNDRK